MPIVRIALDIPLPTLFDYQADEPVLPGQRVIVPFGRRQLIGVVMECVTATDILPEKIRHIVSVLPDSTPLSTGLLDLLKFCSDYYHYPIGQTVLAALPTRLRSDKPVAAKTIPHYCLTDSGKALNPDALPKRKMLARRILNKLSEQACHMAQIRALSPSAGAQLKWLESEGWVEQFDASTLSLTLPLQGGGGSAAGVATHTFANAHPLTHEQQQAVDSVTNRHGYGCFLLHGITGSGKTEVYVHLMDHMLQRGAQVLMMVPEINLTPQLEHYFLSRFPDAALVSLHSGLSENVRLNNWQQAQSGFAQIVLGTRLSVFAELPKLGLIIVDEEHDGSYKQQDGLRYSARDVAIFRANQHGVPIVLGSATPSFESYHNAQTGRYSMLKLTGRAQADARLPTVGCINTNQSVMTEGISEILLREIEKRIARGEQSLLFLNRRGYAPVLMCPECGWLSDCKSCAGKMVVHLKDHRLRCHHCGYQVSVPHACPDCSHTELKPVGSGTQRVESVLKARFPDARILRVDRDSTKNKRAWQNMREQIHANEVDILVGTQMLSKGHDFPALTLVGVLDPDSALYSSDFRAAEKLFAQLMQVAGRAGRADKPGAVLIQTAFPDHPLFLCLQRHDFEGWAAAQLAERRMAGFPPFVYQVMLRAEGKEETEVYKYLNAARSAAIELKYSVDILGVVPASLARRADYIRAQLLVQADSRRVLQQFLRDWRYASLPSQKLRCSLDVDPVEF
jgi:primosomal protein N' (replication factor Y)